MNFVKFLRTPFLTEYLRWLLLKGWSDFQIKGLDKERERERERERDRDRDRERQRERKKERQRQTDKQRVLRVRLSTEKVLQYSTLMRSSRGDHSIDVPDNIYECLSGLTCLCFFKIMNFSDRLRQCFKLLYSFEK